MRNFTDDWIKLIGVTVIVLFAIVAAFVVIAAVLPLFH